MVGETDILKGMFRAKGISDEKILVDLIDSHNNAHMLEGIRYYNNEGDILRRRLFRYEAGKRVLDTEKPNRRLAHNWHKLLVDQKTAYLTGNPVRFNAENPEATRLINRFLGERFDDTLCELAKGSANKGVEWLQLFIDEEGKFGFCVIPAQQVIPIWDTSLLKKLVGVVRYYPLSTEAGENELVIEWWNDNTVKYFSRRGGGRIRFIREAPHFYRSGVGYGWGRVPFVAFKNNEEMLSDLKFYKQLIDDYDINMSDFSNNLSEIQEVVTVLKGYEGTDLREFSENLRYYKVIKVGSGDGSGVEKLELSIPVEAKRELLNRLEENIFLFGQGVNVKTDRFGASPSGIALKFLYSLLDMKAGITERKFVVAVKEVLWFLFEYAAISKDVRYDPDTVAVVFDKRMVLNELEMAQIALHSKGIISDRTIISHHPWTEDVDDEIKNTAL
ncbi:MAG: Phage portal protein, SPP1 Gp6-like [Firmicutes bacterium ADurb.Bin193]|nr:MAG: Phage portal protein, SPP1 Gp6-like [Firmicutes bacterium ADurb.Bin193]